MYVTHFFIEPASTHELADMRLVALFHTALYLSSLSRLECHDKAPSSADLDRIVLFLLHPCSFVDV